MVTTTKKKPERKQLQQEIYDLLSEIKLLIKNATNFSKKEKECLFSWTICNFLYGLSLKKQIKSLSDAEAFLRIMDSLKSKKKRR